jgi:ribonuclease HII
VVAAAVVLGRRRLAIRVDDSKRLTPLQRERAFHAIQESGHVGIGIVCSGDIDRLNILQATFQAMRLAVEDLADAPDAVLVDGPHTPALAVPAYPFVRGDARSYVIACASIMAKVFRDRLMTFYHDLAPDYAFHLHKGYGTAAHADRLKQFGPCLFHRRSFHPVLEAASAWFTPAPASASEPNTPQEPSSVPTGT